MEGKVTLNLLEAAQLAGISLPVMRKLVLRPGFPALRAGRRWVIPRTMFLQWIDDEARKGVQGA